MVPLNSPALLLACERSALLAVLSCLPLTGFLVSGLSPLSPGCTQGGEVPAPVPTSAGTRGEQTPVVLQQPRHEVGPGLPRDRTQL